MGGEPRFVGIDVSKTQVDVAVRPTGKRWALPYDETGIEGLIPQIVDLGPALVLLEATGGLELPLCGAESWITVSTDDPTLVLGCRDRLELVAENEEDQHEHGSRCLHCRQEIRATGGVDRRRVDRRPCPHCGRGTGKSASFPGKRQCTSHFGFGSGETDVPRIGQ